MRFTAGIALLTVLLVVPAFGAQQAALPRLTVPEGDDGTVSLTLETLDEVAADENGLETSVDEGEPIVKDNCAESELAITAHRSDGRDYRLADAHPRYRTGFTSVTWTVTDKQGQQASAFQQIVVRDSPPPPIEAPPNVVANTDRGKCSAFVSVGSATLSRKCPSCTIYPVRSDGKRRVDMPFPAGRTTIVWTAANASGKTTSAEQEVVVQHTEGPVIGNVTVTPKAIWPSNGRMVGVKVRYDAIDPCGGAVIRSLRVASNEPGSVIAPDWDVINDHFVDLRAESSGNGERVYTISITAVDDAGNQSTETAAVKVRPPD